MEKNKKTFKKIIIILLVVLCIIIFLSAFVNFISGRPIFDVHKLGIEPYLKEKNYNDEFTNIEFVSSGNYQKKWKCDGANFEDTNGKYYKYKVHSVKEDVDFYVQYRSELYYDNNKKRSVPGYEDNYYISIAQKDIFNRLHDILGNDVQINFKYNSIDYDFYEETNQLIVSNIFDVECNINNNLENFYNEESLKIFKVIKNILYDYNRTKDYHIRIYLSFSDCTIISSCWSDYIYISFSIDYSDEVIKENLLNTISKFENWINDNVKEIDDKIEFNIYEKE